MTYDPHPNSFPGTPWLYDERDEVIVNDEGQPILRREDTATDDLMHRIVELVNES
jgi:glutathionyl-hydroquinone reductase